MTDSRLAEHRRSIIPTDLELWHVGAVVRDMAAAIDDEMMLGATGVSVTARLDGYTYDAVSDQVFHEVLDVAWVRQAHDRGTIELICPCDPDGPAPQSRLLRERSGVSHRAYWCQDLARSAQWLIDAGGRLLLAPLISAPSTGAALGQLPIADLMAISQTCYIILPGGAIVELNPVSSREHMPAIWGSDVHSLLPIPH